MHTKRYPSELDAAALQYAREHLKETPKKRTECLTKLRQHFEDNEHHINLTTEDDVLLAFLRSAKYNLPCAINKLKNYYAMRAEMPGVFSGRDPRAERIMQEVLALGCFVPLRKLHHGRLVLVVRVSAFDPSRFALEEILKMAYMVLDWCNKICPHMQVHGVCAIFDLKGMSFAHARLMTPSIIRHMVHAWQDYHCRPKQLEFINAPMFVNVLLNVFRSFMKKKMRDRLRVHGGGDASLLEFLEKEVLPTEYGGEDGSIDEHAEFWLEEITKNADWFLFDENFKIIS